jgi:hypothetical protein
MSKSAAKLARALADRGFEVSDRTVLRLLKRMGYSLQANQKTREGADHPDRDAQFAHINDTVARAIEHRQPAIGVDTKKREMIGESGSDSGGSQLTAKCVALLTVPTGAAVLVTLSTPLLAPLGTVAFSVVEDTYVTVLAAVPLKLTVELFVKPTPVIVTTFPTAPLVGVKLATDNVGLNRLLLVAVPAGVVTEISPEGAPSGTVASICVAESTVKVAFAEPKCTAVALLRPVPVIVTVLPVIPVVGVNDVIVGRSEITAAVASERAGAPAPAPLLAVACTRIVAPT